MPPADDYFNESVRVIIEVGYKVFMQYSTWVKISKILYISMGLKHIHKCQTSIRLVYDE